MFVSIVQKCVVTVLVVWVTLVCDGSDPVCRMELHDGVGDMVEVVVLSDHDPQTEI